MAPRQVMNEWTPDIHVDGHHGGSVPYVITYQGTLNPAADAALFQAIRDNLDDKVRLLELDCEILIPDDAASRCHAAIQRDASGFVLVDDNGGDAVSARPDLHLANLLAAGLGQEPDL